MFIVVGKDIEPEIGGVFLKYFYQNCYDKGEVVKATDAIINVDFGDTEYEFDVAEVSRVYSAGHSEHLMTCSPGRLVRDYRTNPPKVMEIEDLLDFDKWLI